MNPITVHQPTRLCVMDSCPFRIKGLLLEGSAWCVRIPASISPIYGQLTANNLLELLRRVVNIWLMCLAFLDTSVTTCDWQQHIRYCWRVAITIEPPTHPEWL